MSWWQLPAILLTFFTWLQSQPVSLADAAARESLRRQLTSKSVRSLTNDDVDGLPKRPLPSVPVDSADVAPKPAAAAGAPDPTKPGEVRDEVWWRTHFADARALLERNQVLAEALQSSIDALTTEWSARDDPAQRQQIVERRTRAVEELGRLKEQIEAGKKTIADLEESARRDSVPAAWIR